MKEDFDADSGGATSHSNTVVNEKKLVAFPTTFALRTYFSNMFVNLTSCHYSQNFSVSIHLLSTGSSL